MRLDTMLWVVAGMTLLVGCYETSDLQPRDPTSCYVNTETGQETCGSSDAPVPPPPALVEPDYVRP